MRIRSKFVTKAAARVGTLMIQALFKTCRVKMFADDPNINCYKDTGGERYLYCVWHDQILTTVFSGKPQSMAGLVSQHQDGSYLADALELVGITPVRGSTSRGGARAMRELIERTAKLHVCITPDGPRGPRRELKMGLVFLASHSGRSIIPAAYACRRAWRWQGNWTDMLIPKPFTTIYVRGGLPIPVPRKLGREGLEEYRQKLQAEMELLDEECQALARGGVVTRVLKTDAGVPAKKAA